MTIVNMKTLNETQLAQAAQVLTDELPMGWATFADAVEEIDDLLSREPDHLFLAAMENSEVLGWGGMMPSYDGHVYELHPLVVRKDRQRGGIGTGIINALMDAAREKGGKTFWLGADDEAPVGETSFANVDLYDDLPRRIREFEPGTHQSGFYLKLGFKIIGVMPDANGTGKPDIFMAKPL